MGREAQLRKTDGGTKGVSVEGDGRFSAQGGRIAGEKALNRKRSGIFGERRIRISCANSAVCQGMRRGKAASGRRDGASEGRARESASHRPVSGLVRKIRPGYARHRRGSCMEKGPGKAGNRNASGERKPDSGVSGGASPFRRRCGRRGRSSGCFPETAGRVAKPEQRCARCGSAGWAALPEGKFRGKGRCPVLVAR